MIRLHTSAGEIDIELYEDRAPETCANFKQYTADQFYDATVFHRVIQGFMVQGGGFTRDMQQKKARGPIKNEADNGVSNRVGTVAMARTPDPHSASSQFFINVADNTFLDFKSPTPQGWGYCVFGCVARGMDVVRDIEKVPTGPRDGHGDVPVEPLLIEKAEIIDD